MKNIKTNAMRLLDKAGITYETLTYDLGKEPFSGEAVSGLLGLNSDECFKTLACTHERDLFLFVIPVSKNLDLKKAAAAVGVKNVDMIKVKDLKKKVGYERGSVSPVNVLVPHHTVFDQAALKYEEIEISGGKLGIGIKLNSEEIVAFLRAEVKDICL